MKDCIRALLVQTRHDSLSALRLAIEEQSIDTFAAANCAEAAQALWSDCPPHLVFAEIQLADGDWADVLTPVREGILASERHRGGTVCGHEVLCSDD